MPVLFLQLHSAESCTLRALNSQLRHTHPWALLKTLVLGFCVMWGDGFQRARWTMLLWTHIPRWRGKPLLNGLNHFPHMIHYVWKGTAGFWLAGAPDDLRYPFTQSLNSPPPNRLFLNDSLDFFCSSRELSAAVMDGVTDLSKQITEHVVCWRWQRFYNKLGCHGHGRSLLLGASLLPQ